MFVSHMKHIYGLHGLLRGQPHFASQNRCVVGARELDLCGSGQEPAPGSWKCSNEPVVPLECRPLFHSVERALDFSRRTSFHGVLMKRYMNCVKLLVGPKLF
jgi:hypothetical protein